MHRDRRMSIHEMMRLQGILPGDFEIVVSDIELGKQIGNAMSLNVVERLLPQVLRAANLLHGANHCDRWKDGSAIEEMIQNIECPLRDPEETD